MRVCLELSLLVLVVDQKGDQDYSFPGILKLQKGKKRNFETRESAHVGLWAVTCQGYILWVYFCSAVLPI